MKAEIQEGEKEHEKCCIPENVLKHFEECPVPYR